MKIKEDFIYKSIAGQDIVIPVGKSGVGKNSLLTLKGSGAFIYKILYNGATEEEVVAKLMENYEVDENTAKADVAEFIEKLRGWNMLESE